MLDGQKCLRSEGTVLVLARNAETLDGMKSYFMNTGIEASTRRVLNPLAELLPTVRGLVVFPDDFPAHQSFSYLSMIRTRRVNLTLVVVTQDPSSYSAITSTDGHPLNAIVLPRPVFGWTILDAIRSTFDRHEDEQ